MQGLLLMLSGLSTGFDKVPHCRFLKNSADGIVAKILNCNGNWLYDLVSSMIENGGIFNGRCLSFFCSRKWCTAGICFLGPLLFTIFINDRSFQDLKKSWKHWYKDVCKCFLVQSLWSFVESCASCIGLVYIALTHAAYYSRCVFMQVYSLYLQSSLEFVIHGFLK